ncbi:PREDICTED: Holliday junction recognition protein [Rhinopithecus bieti]|uniref:Holliday junction recognition protein n=1 Tax=Rhinopithecus bieti TaxID=61621 RepID=UPI00083BFF88|nr:PREDICTED: Holliday junction recognition protein [Rhinopithecus bieti]XP_017745879.1 PREDICTED: Holliday junction recognition protein [Rhinopithecus bieti]
MESQDVEDDLLLQKLRASRRRFQRRMQLLIEKYNQPFEDTPVVQMATLTYETPQGLRIWGGRLIKERNEGEIQDSPVRPADRTDGSVQPAAQGPEFSSHHTVLGADSKSGDINATSDQEESVAWALAYAGNRAGKDTRVTPLPSLASPAMPAPGYCSRVSGNSPGDPAKPASSPREWDPSHPSSTDMALVPRNDSLSLQETSSSSFLSSQHFEDDDICNVTISDLYAGMLHSMSRLLSTKPSSIISTKTFIMQNWNSRRRHRCKSRMNKTYCKGARRSQRSSKENFVPCCEPMKDTGALRDCKKALDVPCHKTGLKLEKAFLEVNKPQIHKLDPSWKELKVTPSKYSSLIYFNSSATYNLDQENRFRTLKWLISPVKIVSRPRIRQGHGEDHQREIEMRFDQLHREYCLSPRNQPRRMGLPDSWAMNAYQGDPVSPGGLQGLETCRLSLPSSKAKASLSEAFENLAKRSLEAGRCLPKSNSSSLPKANPTHSPARPQQTSDLHVQGNSSGIFRKSVSPIKTLSVPDKEVLGHRRNRYDEIKEEFDKLHQKYCLRSPGQMKVPSCIGVSTGKASMEVRYQTEGKLNPDPHFQGFQKLPSSPLGCRKSLLGSTAIEAHSSTCVAHATKRNHHFPAKRPRLSDPQGSGCQASSQGASDGVGNTVRPGDQGSSSQPNSEERKRKEHVLQDGREVILCQKNPN